MYPRVGEKRRLEDINLEDEEAIGSLCRLSGRPASPKSAMEQEKRIRREIANSNERRRMQSINAGFASLKTLLPHHEGEKLSKAAILQQTAEYIYQLEQEKTTLLSQNSQLKRLLNNHRHHSDTEGSPTGGESPDDRSVSEGTPPPPTTQISLQSSKADTTAASPCTEELRREVIDTRVHLDRERKHRIKLEEHIRGLEAEMYPEKTNDAIHSDQSDYTSLDRRTSMETVKIEIKEEDFRNNNNNNNNHRPKTTVSEIISTTDHIYGDDVHEIIHLPKTFGKNVTSSSRVNIAAPTNLCTTNTIASVQSRSTAILQPPTTIVTVLPSNKVANNAVLEWRDVDTVQSTGIATECIETSAPMNHTRVFIVNSTSSPCQKSLDTICEAIRHLEGDHMFPIEDQGSTPRIEEEVVTEETYTIEEGHHSVPQGNYDNFNCHSPMNAAMVTQNLPSNHHSLGGSMSHLTLHMIQPEPQEVPLELTTTHRVSDQSQQYVAHDGSFNQKQQQRGEISSSHSPNSSTVLRPQNSTRPGVIVVKHT